MCAQSADKPYCIRFFYFMQHKNWGFYVVECKKINELLLFLERDRYSEF